jgi:transcriptional antiterminator RfaH
MNRWYLLYCKRGEQSRAKLHLENQAIECYYPQIEIEKIKRGKRQRVSEPMFPSYMFVRFDYEQGPSFTTLRSTRGVVDFIRFGAQPQVVRDALIDELKQLESAQSQCEGHEVLEPGQSVSVKAGQFAGFEAIFKEPDGDARSIMLVNLINKSVPVSIDNRDLDV